jgi:NodT family efflux transporter outer membrane factor (OMF) lipoprotein
MPGTDLQIMHIAPLFMTLVVVAASGCSVAPKLTLPDVPTAAAYKEPSPWTTAVPADELPRDAWWNLYQDDRLSELQDRLAANSPDLAAALARYDQALAYSAQLRSDLFPSIALQGQAQRARQSETNPPSGSSSTRYYNSYVLGAQASYEIDLWGRVRNNVRYGRLSAEAAAADLQSARLSLQAELADTYIALRGLDKEAELLEETVQAYDRALSLTQDRYRAGIVSGLDVSRAQSQLDAARSQSAQTQAQRATLEHAIAALIGASPSEFTLQPQSSDLQIPNIPAAVPADLLQRRPDIAAAQRRTAAANASVGVARSAFFPSIALNASYGFASNASANWLTAPNAAWAIGPSLLLELFDGGRRRAQVDQAVAVLEEAGANYRATVLGAFQQVEDNLALMHHFGTAAESERAAASSAEKSLEYAQNRYKEGAASYLEVVESQTTALTARRAALDLDTRRLRASVALIRALGGGWSQEQMASSR